MTASSFPQADDLLSSKTMRFWARMLDPLSLSAAQLRAASEPLSFHNFQLMARPNFELIEMLSFIEGEIQELQAQQLCIHGVTRCLLHRLRHIRFPFIENASEEIVVGEALAAEPALMLTDERLTEHWKAVLPRLPRHEIDRMFPREMQYYSGITTTLDYLKWLRKAIDADRHHRRCGLTITSLAETAIVDAFIQQPSEGLLNFLKSVVRTEGCIEDLASLPYFVTNVREALRFVHRRLPRWTDARLKVEELLSFSDAQQLLETVMGYWETHSVGWFQVRELLHDFAPEQVLIFEDEYPN